MARMNRRRTLIGLGSIVFGASGFIASGAFTFGSEGSLGDSFVQVEGTNQAVEFNTPQLTDEAAVSEGGEGDDDNGGGDGEDDGSGESDESADGSTGSDESTDGEETTDEEQTREDPQEDTDDETDTGGGGGGQTPSTRVQVVTEPNNSGNAVNTPGAAQWNGSLVSSDILLGTDQGFFGGIKITDASKNAINTLGTLNSDGYPDDLIAFVIANVGPENGGAGQAVDVSTQLFTDGSPLETEQLRFPYRVVDSSGTTTTKGENLLAESAVRLPDSHVIEIVIIVDTRTGTEEIERVDSIRFIAEGVN